MPTRWHVLCRIWWWSWQPCLVCGPQKIAHCGCPRWVGPYPFWPVYLLTNIYQMVYALLGLAQVQLVPPRTLSAENCSLWALSVSWALFLLGVYSTYQTVYTLFDLVVFWPTSPRTAFAKNSPLWLPLVRCPLFFSGAYITDKYLPVGIRFVSFSEDTTVIVLHMIYRKSSAVAALCKLALIPFEG